MKRRLLLAVLVVAASSVTIPVASATPPEPISVALEETFTGSGVVGTFEASGGVFGSSTSGTMESVSYKPGGFSIPSRDHYFVYTATDHYMTSSGSFFVAFEGSCAVVEIDLDTLDATLACSGNWQVNGGTGDYARLKGTGTFDEVQNINLIDVTGDGTLELSGKMHTD